MSFGKAHKQKRNLDFKLSKKKLLNSENLEAIKNLDDEKMYSISDANKKPLFNGAYQTGKSWKLFYGLK